MKETLRSGKVNESVNTLPIQGKRIYLPTNREHLIPPPLDIVKDLDIENFSIPLPPGKSLLPFQDPAIRKMLWFMKHLNMKGVYNGYDPGLGKTLMATVIGANILKSRRILVVCPSGVRGNWEEEIRMWDNDKDPISIHTIYSARGCLRPITAKWCVVSYRLLLKHNVFDRLYENPWDFIIFDEAKELKSMRAKQTILSLELWNRARRGMLMDGTPMTRSAQDLFVPCHTLMPEEFMSEDDFCEEYCLKRKTSWGYQRWEYFSGNRATLPKLSKIIRDNFFVRKTKEEVLPDLPETTYQKIILECGKFDKKLTELQERAILSAIRDGKDPNSCVRPEDKKHISERRLEAGLKTLKEGKDFIGNLLEGNIPVMVIAYHTPVIESIMQVFQAYHPARIDGSVVGAKKDRERDRFNSGATNLIVLQIKAAVGINLQKRCSTAVYIELSYDPMQIRQSLDRIRRIGQKTAINAHFMVAKGSVDEEVFKVLKQKLEIIDATIVSTDE